MYDEHIEAMIGSFRENGLPLNPGDIAEAVLDIVYAQGLVTKAELDLAHTTIAAQVEYLLDGEQEGR
jgi:hypothetical protein